MPAASERRQKSNSRRLVTTNHASHMRNLNLQSQNRSSEERSDHRYVVNVSHTTSATESHRDDAAARHLEAEHRQQIIDLQRRIEQQAVQSSRDANTENSPTNVTDSTRSHDPVAEYSQQIIDLQREIERQAVRRQEERRPDALTPHMPPRLINSSTIRTSIYTITPGSANYPNAPPITPDGDRDRISHFTNRSNSKGDDELPSYEQAVAFETTTQSVKIRRY